MFRKLCVRVFLPAIGLCLIGVGGWYAAFWFRSSDGGEPGTQPEKKTPAPGGGPDAKADSIEGRFATKRAGINVVDIGTRSLELALDEERRRYISPARADT